MNRFKRDMNRFIGESPRFNESLKQRILLNAKDGNKPKGSVKKGFNTFKFAAIFALLLIVVTSFLAITITQDGQEAPTSSSEQFGESVKNFSDESKSWKVTYTQKDLGDGGRESFMTVEYIGEGSKPEEITYQFVYKKDQESFGGLLLLKADGGYDDVSFETCTTCILYAEDDEIPGTIEWEGHQESLVLIKTNESKWQESPLFESNNYTMLGEEGRAGFIYEDDGASRFYENIPQKYMWHFWGSQVELTGTFKVLGTHENTSEAIIVVPEGKSRPSPNNGADHHIPTTMSLPEKGMWRLEAIFNDKVIGTVFVEVEKPVVTDSETVADIPTFTEYDAPVEVFHFKSDAMDRGNHEYAAYPLLIDPTVYNEKDIARGDVVLYEYAFSNGVRRTVSRVVGLPGESIDILDGQIIIDGQKLVTFYGKAHRVGTSSLEEYQKWFEENTSPNSTTTGMENIFQMDLEKIQLAEDEVFLVGDDWFRGSQHKLDVADLQGKVIGYYKE